MLITSLYEALRFTAEAYDTLEDGGEVHLNFFTDAQRGKVGYVTMTPDQARRLASALVNAANKAQNMCGRQAV